MSEDPPNLVLDLLRAIRGDIGQMRMDMASLKQRMTTVEIQIGNLVATEQSHYGQTMLRLDRIDSRLEHMERRKDIAEA